MVRFILGDEDEAGMPKRTMGKQFLILHMFGPYYAKVPCSRAVILGRNGPRIRFGPIKVGQSLRLCMLMVFAACSVSLAPTNENNLVVILQASQAEMNMPRL